MVLVILHFSSKRECLEGAWAAVAGKEGTKEMWECIFQVIKTKD
jgi:hypothetical protein